MVFARSDSSARSYWAQELSIQTVLDQEDEDERVDIAVNFERFKQERVIATGEGSGAVIELLQDPVTGERVVAKKFPQKADEDPTWVEVAITLQMGHPRRRNAPGYCGCYGAFMNDEGHLVLILEYVPNGDLFEFAGCALDPGPERERVMWPVIDAVVLAVGNLHRQGVAHRDISLENILLRLSPDGQPCGVALIDFGLAKVGNLTRVTGRAGKAAYMAPEMHTGEPFDARAVDAFACGVTIYTLLFGTYPWSSTVPGECDVAAYVLKHGFHSFLRKKHFQITDRGSVSALDLLSPEAAVLLLGLCSDSSDERLNTLTAAVVQASARNFKTPSLDPPSFSGKDRIGMNHQASLTKADSLTNHSAYYSPGGWEVGRIGGRAY